MMFEGILVLQVINVYFVVEFKWYTLSIDNVRLKVFYQLTFCGIKKTLMIYYSMITCCYESYFFIQ